MIVPLPTWLLDVLLATNLSLSVAILLVVLYVPDALAIATFPTLLLLTTLFRLALNVSTTRLILIQANAGDVIRAFGNFVVRGNYVVGAVVFLILTIIQFIVIAKGSERVAEVGARFVLDAMPGKQMAIDAELRSGTIDGNEARRRRRMLSRESQFYGSMDGAMKFVKGDVIASLVITVVNILGGLGIGVGQKGMDAVTALKRYGLLTIGDGLVSQIPALVLSTAAGVLVTRVASEEPETPLGEELAGQLFGLPKALKMATVFVVLLALVPGLPAVPFLVIGAALFFIARARTRQIAREDQRAATEPRPVAAGARREAAFVPMVVPWSIEISEDLALLLDDEGSQDGREGLRSVALGLREKLFAELGVPLPAPRVRVTPGLPSRHAVMSLFEVPARVFSVAEGLSDADAVTAIGNVTAELLRTRAADFLGLAECQRMLDELEQFAPATVRNVVPKPVSLTLLTDILRRLVEERVSIRDLRAILEALAGIATTEKDPLNLAELVRSQLRRAMTFRLTRGQSQLGVVLIDPTIEDTVRRAITRTPAGAFLTLPPAASRDVVTSLKRAAGEASAQAPGLAPVFLTQPDIRRFVRKLVESDLPDATVVSFAELLPEVTLRPLARANLAGIG
ncbi:Flagellar biosynthesis protein FlhA [Labilithrix luteola]|uniref:Flagellar biosynthesis protein FlhA n=2 Tax=Labilithrix luteola TaxID=1391654 RepID=A0A0K1Q8S3_9BACT|nr:Flagellar biosynthesis protein FlhA [Labilithrix luteola]